MDVKDKLILLTGAGSGIGRALAHQLAAAGARLILGGRNARTLTELCTLLPGDHHSVAADIASAAGRSALVVACAEGRQPLDGVINNAGINHFALFADLAESDIEAMLATNLVAPILLTRALLPGLRERPEALIVNIGSAFGSLGFPGFATYSAGKFGLRGFSEALRRELAASPVKVLYVAPRATRTGLNASAVDALNAALKNAVDTPEAVAAAIVAAIARGRPVTHIGRPEAFFARLNALLPKVVDGALAKQLATIVGFTKHANGDHRR